MMEPHAQEGCRRSAERWQREVQRCRREVSEAEEQLRAGNPDVASLCLALADWSAELRIIEEERRRAEHPAAGARRDYFGRP